jgi:transposase
MIEGNFRSPDMGRYSRRFCGIPFEWLAVIYDRFFVNNGTSAIVFDSMIANNSTQQSLPLEEPPADGRIYINQSLWFVDQDGYRVVFRWHEPLYRVALDDTVHLRQVAVSLRQSQLATQEEIAKAFGHSEVTQRRWERGYQQHGLEGLKPKSHTGRPCELNKGQETFVRKWFKAGVSNVEMAKRLGVGETTIRRTLKRLGLKRRADAVDRPLPGMEEDTSPAAIAQPQASDRESCESVIAREQIKEQDSAALRESASLSSPSVSPGSSLTIDQDPSDRSGDRALARLGVLEDAVPLFADAEQLPRAGVLLAVPLLASHGLVEVFQKVYGSLGPAFYGLRTTVVTLFLCALLRIKRPEELKEHCPSELGRVIGLDRAPEVKTVRRKFSRMAAMERARVLMEELAQRRIEQDRERIAFLYVDGHVREYYGKHPLSKTKKAQRQVAAPAATDTWVHDTHGEPLLVVTSEINAKLTQVLEPILKEVKGLVPEDCRITVVFDRGGYSAKLFSRLIEDGFDLITYRKGKSRKLPRSQFHEERLKIDGKWVSYQLCDRPRVRVGQLRGKRKKRVRGESPRYLWLREVRILRDDGRQTPIFTNRTDLQAVEVAYRVFNRWRQENFFKYMAEEFALDALIEYGVDEVSEELDRPNPEWNKVDKRLRKAKAEVTRLEAELGAKASANQEATRPTMRGFKVAHAVLRNRLKQAKVRVQRLYEKRKAIPKRIPASDLATLKTEKKLIMDSIKMAAYQVETELFGLLQDHYARCDDEGRTLLHSVFQSSARLEVSDGELRVTIAAQSSPHRTQALATLCEKLNAAGSLFPGTQLRLRLAVEPHQPVTS